MISSNQLAHMSQLKINKIEHNTLINIESVSVEPSLSAARRMESYLDQIKNPYCFLCGNVPVKIEFTANAKPIEEKIFDYFIGLKNR